MSMTDPGLAAPALGRSEPRQLRLGYIPLVDAAILFAAEEMGFARAEGLQLDLRREVSWSNIRDRLAFRQFDAAHLLGAMAVAAQVGIGTNPFPIIAPMSLGRGGNAITLSTALADAIDAVEPTRDGAPIALQRARQLATVVRARADEGQPPLVFGVVYPFSSHNYEFRFWLAAGGIDPDHDVRMTVVPPPMTAAALQAGAIDGFCVNAPWNVEAVKADVGRIVAVKADIWPAAPEKVLGVRPDWARDNAQTLSALLRALEQAARWCDDAANHRDLAAILSSPRYLGTDEETLLALLGGRLRVGPAEVERHLPDYLVFHRDWANRPRPAEALWTFSQMVRWGQAKLTPEATVAAAGAFRPDLYDAAIDLGDPRPEPSVETGFLDGRAFDPLDLAAYLVGFQAPDRGNPPDDKFDD